MLFTPIFEEFLTWDKINNSCWQNTQAQWTLWSFYYTVKKAIQFKTFDICIKFNDEAFTDSPHEVTW